MDELYGVTKRSHYDCSNVGGQYGRNYLRVFRNSRDRGFSAYLLLVLFDARSSRSHGIVCYGNRHHSRLTFCRQAIQSCLVASSLAFDGCFATPSLDDGTSGQPHWRTQVACGTFLLLSFGTTATMRPSCIRIEPRSSGSSVGEG